MYAAVTIMAEEVWALMKEIAELRGYLPLAHIMELVVKFTMLSSGALIRYGRPQTLTSTGVQLAKGLEGYAPWSA